MSTERLAVAVTGSDGFIGRNLCTRLRERGDVEVVPITRGSTDRDLEAAIARAGAVFHLAGVNRTTNPDDFMPGNRDLSAKVASLARTRRGVPVILTSSSQAGKPSPYGDSKLAAEEAFLAALGRDNPDAHVFRLPNVFGKWCRPNYNSAVATFCHNIARDLPISIHDPTAPLTLVYVDDVVDAFVALLPGNEARPGDGPYRDVAPQYRTTVGEMAEAIWGFHRMRRAFEVDRVGGGFLRALYATYLSYLPTTDFAYPVVRHDDPRGGFAEMLRTKDSGQVSYFTSAPGVTRGGHYHHTKNEKFLVVQGRARFRFRNIATGEAHAIDVSGDAPTVVDTVPGWAHDITNTGSDPLLVLLWANENFDRQRPDTIAAPLP